jgi:prepilin signal peptidase PulO-like enzyme (type II secretory pathway)
VWQILLGLAVGAGFFGAQYVISRGTWIGGGDLRLGALLGVMLGWPVVLVALFLAYVVGGFVAVILLLNKRVEAKTALPFGVFLAPAGLAALFWGEQLVAWYLGIL